jgi:ABC-2 type transport system ATP-binding protein
MKIIELCRLAKSYRQKKVLTDVSCTFRKGELALLVGENGSGKSTLLKGILGFIKFRAGEVALRTGLIGYVPERFAFPPYCSVGDFLKGLCPDRSQEEISNLLAQWELADSEKCLLKNLSKGMAQKVLIIQALLTKAELYLFDEPLNGLDQRMQEFFLANLHALKKQGATVIIATHFPERFRLCAERMLILENGVLYDTPSPLSF